MSHRKLTGWLVAVGLLYGVAVAAALAQEKGPPKEKGPKGKKNKRLKLVEEPKLLKLLVQEPLQNDLGMTATQRTNIIALADQYRQWAENPTGNVDPATLPPRERNQLRKKLRDAESRLLDRLDRALTAAQWKRLWQIELQLRGVEIFFEAAVARELTLSQEQQRRIATIRRTAQVGVEDFRQEVKGRLKGPEAKRLLEDAEQVSRTEAERRIGAVLTSTQKARLRRLLGNPIDVSSLRMKGKKDRKAPRPKLQKDI